MAAIDAGRTEHSGVVRVQLNALPWLHDDRSYEPRGIWVGSRESFVERCAGPTQLEVCVGQSLSETFCTIQTSTCQGERDLSEQGLPYGADESLDELPQQDIAGLSSQRRLPSCAVGMFVALSPSRQNRRLGGEQTASLPRTVRARIGCIPGNLLGWSRLSDQRRWRASR